MSRYATIIFALILGFACLPFLGCQGAGMSGSIGMGGGELTGIMPGVRYTPAPNEVRGPNRRVETRIVDECGNAVTGWSGGGAAAPAADPSP